MVDFLPKTKLEVAIADALLERTLEIIVDAAPTGKIGDGKTFVTDLDQPIRSRTSETGQDAVKSI